MTLEMPDLTVEIEFEADVWTDVSADVLAGSTQRGLSRFGGVYTTADAGSLDLTLSNREAAYDPTNEESPHWKGNRIANPGFEVDTTGWAAQIGSETIARSTAAFHSGVASLEVNTTGVFAEGARYVAAGIPIQGATDRASAWVRAKAAGDVGEEVAIILGAVTSAEEAFATIALSLSWQQVTVDMTWTLDTGTAFFVDVRIGAGPVIDYYVDDVELRRTGETLITPMKRIRVIADTEPLWFGHIDAWQLEYPGVGHDAIARVRATDPIKYWSNVRRVDPAVVPTMLTGEQIAEFAAHADLDWPPALLDIDPGTVQTTAKGSFVSTGNFETFWPIVKRSADAEIGDLYYAGDGTLVFRDRESITTSTRSTVPQAVFGDDGSELPYISVSLVTDDTQLANVVRATSTIFPDDTQTATDTASIANYLRRTIELSVSIQTLVETLEHAELVLLLLANPSLRFEDLTINPLADPTNLFPEALGREIGDRITVKMRALGRADAISRDVFIRGVAHAWTASTWTTRFTLSDATPWTMEFFTFDDPALGFDTGVFGWGVL